ncbi:MAG: hypothetical protein U9R17_03840 [Thermodesulfobacteriota bacterium]|nr:hypothetical protein [Thermodesulfobacteriota bacterium]
MKRRSFLEKLRTSVAMQKEIKIIKKGRIIKPDQEREDHRTDSRQKASK